MRLLSIIIIAISILTTSGCSRGNKINGRSFKTALTSVKYMKSHLPQEQRIAFELSFWAIRTAYRKNKEFLDIVDGKTPDELIEVGKEVFAKRKAEGFKEYQQYASWDEMIAKYAEEQNEQTSRKKIDPRDKQNNVLYKL